MIRGEKARGEKEEKEKKECVRRATVQNGRAVCALGEQSKEKEKNETKGRGTAE